MEDYKEKYEMALERAKSAIKNCGDNKGRIAMIESIFPELAESEDERIRKAIIRVFTGESNYTSKEDANKYIAWLEKQCTPAKLDEEEIQKAKDEMFPYQENVGRSYEQALAATGFELGARWASALNEPNISFKELMIRSCIEIALTDVIEKRFSDYGTSLKECLEWIESNRR